MAVPIYGEYDYGADAYGPGDDQGHSLYNTDMSVPPKTLWRNGEAPIYDDPDVIYDDPDTLYDGENPPPKTRWFGESGEASLDTWDDLVAPITDTWDNAADTWDSILDD